MHSIPKMANQKLVANNDVSMWGKVRRITKTGRSSSVPAVEKGRKTSNGSHLKLLFATLSVNYYKEIMYHCPRPSLLQETPGGQKQSMKRKAWLNSGDSLPKKRKGLGMICEQSTSLTFLNSQKKK